MVEKEGEFLNLPKEFELDGRPIRVKIAREARRSLQLKVVASDELAIKAPLKLAEEEIYRFLRQKERWLRQRLHLQDKWSDWPKIRIYQSGEPFLFQGNQIELEFRQQLGWSRYQTFLTDHKIEVWGPREEGREIQKALLRWFRAQAKEKIEKRLIDLSKTCGFSPKSLTLGNGQTLWGTCRSDGSIRINWRGIFLRPEVLDYLLIHELCHLREMNHSPRFWQEVATYIPDWKGLRKELKEQGVLLKEMRE